MRPFVLTSLRTFTNPSCAQPDRKHCFKYDCEKESCHNAKEKSPIKSHIKNIMSMFY